MDNVSKKAQVESILFTMGESVEISKIAAALEIKTKEVKDIVKELQEKYNNPDCGLKIIELDDSYQMCTKPETYEALIKIAKQPKRQVLTDVLMETLSIIAYKQPVTRIELEQIRGVKCDYSVNKLIEYNLVTEVGRLDAPGKPILFGTTEEFLRTFGLSSVEDLPVISADKIADFKIEAEEESQLTLDI